MIDLNICRENNYYRKIVTYHDALPSILACLVERWTGFIEMTHLQQLERYCYRYETYPLLTSCQRRTKNLKKKEKKKWVSLYIFMGKPKKKGIELK
jgi:hypothetical protein